MRNSLVPKPPFFATSERPARCFPRELSVVWKIACTAGASWELTAVSRTDPSMYASARHSLTELPEVIELTGPLAEAHGGMLRITLSELYRALGNGYDFGAALEHIGAGAPRPRVAFAVMSGSERRGGTIQVYRYANWLSDLGFDVTVYSDDPAVPLWARLRCAYRVFANTTERYAAITEDLVIVSSILELPAVLQSRDRSHQRVLHLCQELEEFNFGDTFSEMLHAKPIFHLLNGLRVGRIVVSPSLATYWEQSYRQRAFVIPHGIDPIFRRRAGENPSVRSWGDGRHPLRLVHVANPGHRLKGADVLVEAASWLALRDPSRRRSVHITFLSGPNPRDPFAGLPIPAGVGYTIKSDLSPEEVRTEYRNADVVVNCSFHEGLGIATIEALASGAIVIQADNGGLDGVVEHLSHVLIVPPNNSLELASALSALMESGELRQQLRRLGDTVANRFSVERQYEAFLETFSRLSGAPLTRREDYVAGAGLSPGDAGATAEPGWVDVCEQPRFSVLVPVYNHAHFLPTTLETLRAQTYPHWEAVIVNDGSTDQTPLVMAEYARRDPRFKLVHQVNGGTAAALNAALDHAKHDWICWLSSDDLFKPNKLEIHARYIEALPDYRFFHTRAAALDDGTGIESDPNPPTHHQRIAPAVQTIDMCRWNYVHGNSVAIHRTVFDQAGKFSSRYPNAQDFDMWLRMSVVTPFYLIDEITCTTRNHAAMGTAQFPAGGVLDSYRSIIDFTNGRSIADLTPFAVNETLGVAIGRLCATSADARSFLYRGTFASRSPLLEKLYSDVTAPQTPARWRQQVVQAVRVFVSSGLDPRQTPEVIFGHFNPFFRPSEEYVPFRPIDPLEQFIRVYEVSLQQGNSEMVGILRDYFKRLRRRGVEDVPDLDDLFGSPERFGFVVSAA